ncbi:MAG: hypothetical protein MSC45_00110 [Mobiluncus sp.]|uniref:hypothetical protein n=1 Tax=Mobiluncus sp. TaxID=47293 RepID=UPI00258D2CDE|nr:hypothetical protein [Mobiluncus sp.]MCI6583458.1 hypothetical protein [Mobiluncus sp.]
MFRKPFPVWACAVTVDSGRGKTRREIPRVLVTPASSTDEDGFTEATVDLADMYLTEPGQTPPKSNEFVTVPASHAMHGRFQVEGEADPWPLGVHVSLRRVHG